MLNPVYKRKVIVKKCWVIILLLPLTVVHATSRNYFFYCKTIDNHIVHAYEENNKIVVELDGKKFYSRNSSQEIKGDIIIVSPLNNDYMEFNADKYYVSLGNFNVDKEFDDENGNEKLVINTLSKDRSRAKLTKTYKCSSDYNNNIYSLVD